FLRIEDAGDGFQDRGLAGAVGPKQRDNLAARYFEADAADGHDRPVIALDVADLEDDVGSGHAIALIMRRDTPRRRRDGSAPRQASPSPAPGRSSARSRGRRRD